MSAIHFTMIDCSRTALVWLIDLALMYKAPEAYHQFGENWTAYSPLQAAGFLILIFGQCVYGGVITFPIGTKYLYPNLDSQGIASIKYSRVASRHMATPLPPYSPEHLANRQASKEFADIPETQYMSLGKDNCFAAEASTKNEKIGGA